jgi:hypothetical protein
VRAVGLVLRRSGVGVSRVMGAGDDGASPRIAEQAPVNAALPEEQISEKISRRILCGD